MNAHRTHIVRPPPHLPGPVSVQPLFLLEGEYWSIAYEGSLFRLRDAKGLQYLAYLLGHPGATVHVTDLCVPAAHDSDDGERVRLAVTKRIKAAIKKIAEHHPALGHHLRACIKTGHRCTYLPDPSRPALWQVSGGKGVGVRDMRRRWRGMASPFRNLEM